VSEQLKIRSSEFVISAPDLERCPDWKLPEFAFIGRSNVGKSSLLNMLTGQKNLAKVSATPGHTRLINFFRMNGSWALVDLPGYGFAKTGKAQRDQFGDAVAGYLSGRPNLRCGFVLIDARLPPQQIDLDFLEWLSEYSVPLVLVFTKVDKLSRAAMERNVVGFVAALAEVCEGSPEAIVSSAKTRVGKNEILSRISAALDLTT